MPWRLSSLRRRLGIWTRNWAGLLGHMESFIVCRTTCCRLTMYQMQYRYLSHQNRFVLHKLTSKEWFPHIFLLSYKNNTNRLRRQLVVFSGWIQPLWGRDPDHPSCLCRALLNTNTQDRNIGFMHFLIFISRIRNPEWNRHHNMLQAVHDRCYR